MAAVSLRLWRIGIHSFFFCFLIHFNFTSCELLHYTVVSWQQWLYQRRARRKLSFISFLQTRREKSCARRIWTKQQQFFPVYRSAGRRFFSVSRSNVKGKPSVSGEPFDVYCSRRRWCDSFSCCFFACVRLSKRVPEEYDVECISAIIKQETEESMPDSKLQSEMKDKNVRVVRVRRKSFFCSKKKTLSVLQYQRQQRVARGKKSTQFSTIFSGSDETHGTMFRDSACQWLICQIQRSGVEKFQFHTCPDYHCHPGYITGMFTLEKYRLVSFEIHE